MADPRPRPRRRRWRYLAAALVALALLLGLALHHYTRPRTLAGLLVQQVRENLGMELAFEREPVLRVRPRPYARLRQPELRADGRTLLRADSLEAEVPWHTLWQQRRDIERVELVRPVLDLAVLRAWLAARPPSNAPVPDVRLALKVSDGRVLDGDRIVADGIDIDLANGDDLAAWFRHLGAAQGASLVPPASGHASAQRLQVGDTTLEGVRIELRDGEADP